MINRTFDGSNGFGFGGIKEPKDIRATPELAFYKDEKAMNAFSPDWEKTM